MTVLRLGTNHSKNTSKSKNTNKTARDEALKKCPAMGSQPPSQPPQNSCDGIFPQNSHNGVFATEQPWWCLPQNSICLRTDGICIKKTLSRSLGQVQAPKQSIASTHTHTHKFTLHQREKKKKFFYKGKYSVKVSCLSDGKQSGEVQAHTQSITFWHFPPNSARVAYATEGALFISMQLSTNVVSALWKVWVPKWQLIRLWKQPSAQACT